ncbi:MAG: SRPBCC domain-containing protein [Deltaproteobacteria bacterium]|nr:SRPBCC domain-containing protein [Deltaproteobacteria bacterium]
MHIDFAPDFEISDAACVQHTGKPFAHWFAALEGAGLSAKRRDAIQFIYDATGRGRDIWWPTTIWVEFERHRVVVQKDGRPEGYNICCTKSFKEAPADLFPHFATETALAAWLPGWTGEVAEGKPFHCGACSGTVGRVRPAKDLRLRWQSPGFAATEVEMQFTVMGGKTTVNVFHKRIETRAEADGLRRAWGAALDQLKALVVAGAL